MGVTTEYSPSSTFAELLGIMMTIILVPKNKKIVINTDSRASISIMKNLLENKNNKSTNNSSLKYLLEQFRYWLKNNNREIEFKQVKGHNINKENNYIDQLADRLHNESEFEQSLKLGLLLNQSYQLIYNNNIIPITTKKIYKAQDNNFMVNNFIEQINKKQEEGRKLNKKIIDINLKAINTLIDENLKISKTKWNKTTPKESNIRSFIIKYIIGWLPIMEREINWYPHAYPESYMKTCPLCYEKNKEINEVEDITHFLTCINNNINLDNYKKDENKLFNNEIIELAKTKRVSILTTEKEINKIENIMGKHKVKKKRIINTSILFTKINHIINYDRWKKRCESQIEREESSNWSKKKRKKIMKEKNTIINSKENNNTITRFKTKNFDSIEYPPICKKVLLSLLSGGKSILDTLILQFSSFWWSSQKHLTLCANVFDK